MTEQIQQAEAILKQKDAACVLITKDSRVLVSEQSGIRPLLEWLEKEPEAMRGACAADKVVGKAAALLMAFGGVSQVYAQIISESAMKSLEQNGITFSFGQKVPYIQNRDHSGMCPMEKRCLGLNLPQEAYAALREMVSKGRPAGK